MICVHKRPLRSPCIDCDPLEFMDKKLTEALEGDPENLRASVQRWRDRARAAIESRDD